MNTSVNEQIVGIDIGGANLKFATSDRRAFAIPFELWKFPDRLTAHLANFVSQLLQQTKPSFHIAVTMTGELADCFENKKDGVTQIVRSVENAFPNCSISYFQIGGLFVSAQKGIADWNRTAASNWFALANFAADFFEIESGFLLDIGSTTTDLIPIHQRSVATTAISDLDRLARNELFYSGVSRTPVCAVAKTVALPGPDGKLNQIKLAAEFFATMADVFVVLRQSPEQSQRCDTADGRNLSKANSLARLARCLCSDRSELSESQLIEVAKQIANQHRLQMCEFISESQRPEFNFSDSPRKMVLAGEGEFLARRCLEQSEMNFELISLSEQMGERLSQCAPAFAVAKLLEKNLAVTL